MNQSLSLTNSTAILIVEQLKALGAFTGDSDIRMAIEIAALVGDADTTGLKVTIVDDEVSIAFPVPEDATPSVEQLRGLVTLCDYRLVSAEPPITFARTMNANLNKHAHAAEPGAETTALQEALARANLVGAEGTQIGQDPLRGHRLDAVERNLNETLLSAREELSNLGVNVEAKPVYPEQNTHHVEGTPLHQAPVADVAAEPQTAAEAEAAAFEAHAQANTDKVAVQAAKSEGLSTCTKVAITVGLFGVVGAGLYFGAKHFGVKLPFLGNDVPEAANASDVLAVANS